MKLCVVSFKDCWQDSSGRWMSSGGFPLQMSALASLFGTMSIVTFIVPPREGGIPLPGIAEVKALRPLAGKDLRRKADLLLHAPYYISRLVREIRRADAVHTPLPGDIPLLGMIVALLLRKPLLARYGGSWQANRTTTIMNRLTRMAMRLNSGGRNVMLATGEGERPPSRDIRWIFSTTIGQSELDSITPEFDRPPSSPLRLMYVGRLSPEKGVGTLVDAIAALKDSGFAGIPSVTLIGDGPERAALAKRVRDRGCEGFISFAGQLDRDALLARLSKADLCVQPSMTEGYSKAWLDAMACGVPVLASEVGAARAVIGAHGERGWLVPPGDSRALAESLRDICAGSPDWPRLRRGCREFVEDRTLETWARIIGIKCAEQWGLRLQEGKLHNGLRVAFIAGTLGQGGAEKQMSYMLDGLRRRNASVCVYSLTKGDYYERTLKAMSIPTIWVGRWQHPLARIAAIAWAVKRFQPDVIQSVHPYTNLYASLVGRILRIPSVGAMRSSLRLSKRANGYWTRWLVSWPSALIVNSSAAYREIAATGWVDMAKVHHVPNAIDMRQTEIQARAGDGNGHECGDTFVALFVGRVIPEKRLDLFIMAIELARRVEPSIKGVVVGDGPELGAMRETANRTGLTSEQITFLGTRNDVPSLMRKADVVVSSSDDEGSANVVLEAMSLGLPIISTPAGDADALVSPDGTGYIVPFDDAAAIAARLVSLKQSPELRQSMGEAGKEKAEKLFSPAKQADQLISIYAAVTRHAVGQGRVIRSYMEEATA